MKKKKTRRMMARVVGSVPYLLSDSVGWKVRLAIPRFPFYLDSAMAYTELARAEIEAVKWKGRKVVIEVM